ncbi:ATP-binding protein [Parerythrobacter aestuarii]|uniref:ATP-binding protein n=1 Tax=Parerythrobacter aestuarii TaxID=3020909 RepID=UPI0024DE489B|nr:ATP-binding protein [Parerythrobacter aestuarii]
MEAGDSFPWSGFALAVSTTVVLALAGVDPLLAFLALVVWTGSLWLVRPTPRELIARPQETPFSREGMAEMIEHSGSPLLLTERNRVIIANRSARNILGKHIIGQDVRVALRHPEAVSLVDRKTAGEAIITGLVRPKDIWRLSRYQMENELAVLELVSKTAEVDISRAHTDFVANASHELRTPLASIIGYVETLSEAPENLDSSTAKKFLDTIHREARRLQALVSDLMSLSRIEAEKHERPQSRVDLRQLVERASRDVSISSERDGRLELDLAGEYPIAGDEQQVEQLVRNLVDNAFKYGGAESPVTVRLSTAANGDTKLEVIDRGPGISAEHLPHLTRRFYRTDPGRSLASGGTGLGLAIVKHIVQRHRGRLDIASEAGVGTTITVRIPRWNETEMAAIGRPLPEPDDKVA